MGVIFYYSLLILGFFQRMGFKKLLLFFLTVNASEELLNLNLARQLHDTIYHSFGTGRTSGHIHIDRYYLLDTLHHMVRVFKRTAGYGTSATCYDIFGLGELVVKTAYHRSHTMYNRTCHHHEVGLTW